MERQAVQMLLGFSLLVVSAGTSSYGQSGHPIAVDIPFKFFVDNTPLPPGHYTIQSSGVGKGQLLIRGADGQKAAIVLTSAIRGKSVETEGRLVFNRYGDQYFLVQAWLLGNDIGHKIAKSRAERELAKSAAKPRPRIAFVTGRPQ